MCVCVYNEDVGLGVVPLHVGDREIATNELVEPTPGAGAYREINSATVTSAGAGAIFITTLTPEQGRTLVPGSGVMLVVLCIGAGASLLTGDIF